MAPSYLLPLSHLTCLKDFQPSGLKKTFCLLLDKRCLTSFPKLWLCLEPLPAVPHQQYPLYSSSVYHRVAHRDSHSQSHSHLLSLDSPVNLCSQEAPHAFLVQGEHGNSTQRGPSQPAGSNTPPSWCTVRRHAAVSYHSVDILSSRCSLLIVQKVLLNRWVNEPSEKPVLTFCKPNVC